MAKEPGWYPDPRQPDQQRYWSGRRWTEAVQQVDTSIDLGALPPPTAPAAMGAAPSPSAITSSSTGTGVRARRPLATVVLAALVVVGAMALVSESSDAPPAAQYWDLQPPDVWRDTSLEYYEFSDSLFQETIVGRWSIDALPFLESRAFVTLYDRPYAPSIDGTIEDLADHYRAYLGAEETTVVLDEFSVNAFGLETWEAWGEEPCGLNHPCLSGTFLVLAEDRYLWATIRIRDVHTYGIPEVAQLLDTVNRAS